MQTYSIGELAREFAVSLRTLRFYEDKGLIHPHRQGLNRVYSRREKARIRLILMGKKVGFSLDEIKEMLDLYDLKDGRAPQLKAALDRFGRHVEVLNHKKEDIERAIAELTRTMTVVEGMLHEKEVSERNPKEPALQATG